MELVKMLNVTILACLLILTGCFGFFGDDDVIEDAEGEDTGSGSTTVASGTPPTVQIMGGIVIDDYAEPIPLYNSSTGDLEGYTGFNTSIYYAMFDVDGAITSAGFDIDLDGTIDVAVSNSRGIVNLTIPISEWVVWYEGEEGDGLITTVAFIAIDDDSLHTVEMYSLFASAFEEDYDDGPSMYVLSASDHTDDVEEDAGLMTLTFGNGADLDWALVQIEVVKDSVPYICDNADATAASTNKCTTSQHGGAEDTHWEKGETLIISSNSGDFCEEDCTLTVRIKYDGDVIMQAAVDLK